MKYFLIVILNLIISNSFSQTKYDWKYEKKNFVPDDLHDYTLVVETYNYSEYLEILSHECLTQVDSERNQNYFKKYQNKKSHTLDFYKHSYRYVYKKSYDTLSIEKNRYVLKSKVLLIRDNTEYLPNGECNGYITFFGYYIYDRKLNKNYPIFIKSKLKRMLK